MIISHKHKFIFVHIPKCAGSSIAKCLMQYYGYNSKPKSVDPNECAMFRCDPRYANADNLDQHDQYNKIKQYFEQNNYNINDYFSFSFVRNPWERRVSQFEYVKRMHKEKKEEWTRKWKGLSFKEYIQQQKDCQLNWVSECALPQTSSKKHDVAVNYVGRCENLQEDFNNICDKIEIPHQEVPHVNKTKHKEYTEYYDDETRAIAKENAARDIEYFGYKFEK